MKHPHLLIHMKTALSKDDAQICVAPNVALAAVKEGHHVTMLVDGSAITSITKGYGWVKEIIHPEQSEMDRASLPERERKALAEQTKTPLEKVPQNYGDYLAFLNRQGVDIYANQTMMSLFRVGADQLPSVVRPIALDQMVKLFDAADRVIVY